MSRSLSEDTMDGLTITTDTIRALRAEAAEAGDDDCVCICNLALDKSVPTIEMMDARQQVADIIHDARAISAT